MKSSPDMLNFNVVLQVMTKSLTLADHHVQVPIQSPIIMNEKYKKWRAFRKHGFQRENNLKISDKKTLLASTKQPRGTHGH